MFRFCSLISGSRGNCYYFSFNGKHFLIDAGGLSHKDIIEILEKEIGISLFDLSAVFISHEHLDHVSCLSFLAFKYKVPVICNLNTAHAIEFHFELSIPELKWFASDDDFCIYDMTVTPFSIHHDAIEPVGFKFSYKDFSMVVCTDLGSVSSYLEYTLYGCDVLFIESNHDVQLVQTSDKPLQYKNRVIGSLGHLSNAQCNELIQKAYTPKLKHLFLGHMSQNCNRAELVLNTACDYLKTVGFQGKITLAEQFSKTSMFTF